jgi:hypothetical protein
MKKAFLIWWATMLGLVTTLSLVATYVYPDDTQMTVPKSLSGLTMMVCVFSSWIRALSCAASRLEMRRATPTLLKARDDP